MDLQFFHPNDTYIQPEDEKQLHIDPMHLKKEEEERTLQKGAKHIRKSLHPYVEMPQKDVG